MAVQLKYTINHEALYAGMLVNGRLDDRFSLPNLQGDVIEFGCGVIKDSDGAKLPTPASTAADFIGIAHYEVLRAYKDGQPLGAIPDYDMTIIPFGVIAVKVLEEVNEGDDVYWRVGAEGTGNFCKSAGADGTLSVKLDYKFAQGAQANDIATIELRQ
jgi:hypothetical protein